MRVAATVSCGACVLGLAVLFATACTAQQPAAGQRPRDNWDFRFKDFVIGAWWGPGPTEPEVKLYKECGFNVVMSGRYMQLDDYGDPDKGLQELDLARKYGLGVMFDTYTRNEHPWGGKAGPTDSHPTHHPASLVELEWLYRKLGNHPALIGFMIGDDQGEVSERSAACTKFLHGQPKPQLMPWLCGWIPPQNLAQHNNPIANPQIYPTLYQWGLPAEELARQYAATYAGFSRQCRDEGVIFWPMFNASPPNEHAQVSDSLLRFPAYAALAYGAEGIWYFCYNGGSLQTQGTYTTEAEVRKGLTRLYPVAQRINRRIAAWGPKVLGRTATGLFGTAFGAKIEWPFPEDLAAVPSGEALAPPGKGKLIESMSNDLLVGILTKPGQPPLAMVVDCRASKDFGAGGPRDVAIRFAPAVTRIRTLEGSRSPASSGCEAKMTLEAGGGQLLQLEGQGLKTLCSEASIYAPPPKPSAAAPRAVSGADLARIKAAKLRIDVFGANAEEEYREKVIDLNGHELGRVPSNSSDSWSLRVVDLAPEQLGWVRLSNEVTVRTKCADAWKFRNLTLAVQLVDGTWVKTNTDTAVHSVPKWACSEGETWGEDGVAGPVKLAFK